MPGRFQFRVMYSLMKIHFQRTINSAAVTQMSLLRENRNRGRGEEGKSEVKWNWDANRKWEKGAGIEGGKGCRKWKGTRRGRWAGSWRVRGFMGNGSDARWWHTIICFACRTHNNTYVAYPDLRISGCIFYCCQIFCWLKKLHFNESDFLKISFYDKLLL